MGFATGMFQGFVDSNMSKVSEEELRDTIQKAVKQIQGWLE